MNSTNVPSNEQNNAPACSQMIPTQKEVQIPPTAYSFGISLNQAKNGEIIIPAGEAIIKDSSIITANATIPLSKKMMDVLKQNRKEKEAMQKKAKAVKAEVVR